MRYVFVLFVFFNLSAGAQALQDINYSFLYDPTEPFSLNIKAVRAASGWNIFFDLTLKDSVVEMDQYRILWDLRSSLSDKEGTVISTENIQKTLSRNKLTGKIALPLSSSSQILTAKILNNAVKRVWIFYKTLDPAYPVNGSLAAEGNVITQPFIQTVTPVSFQGEGQSKIISYYNDDFPAAVPAFSEGMGKVARSMKVDSTYSAPVNEKIAFFEKGLYLVQKDTSDAEGFAFRVEDDYPRFSRVESLADPLIYVCTKQEFDKIKAAKGDKKAFDRVILGITGNAERAKNFMRNYFKRVEWANYYFTSYKEGWKTDRGMIYILFGLPDELYKFSDREVWTFKSANLKETFTFVKSSTIFDADNYVLIRQKKFQEVWYEKVDLWRNARF
jgi:GWxTD domain-containing protein